MTPAARLLLAMAGMCSISNFHRAAVGVVAPELAAELAMGPGVLGAANAAFFGALLLAQIPVGVALDRWGPRRLVAALTLPASLGAAAQALAWDAPSFLLARFALGLGCAASFMAAVVLAGRWHRGGALTRAIATTFAWAQAGILLAGAPLAVLSGWVGWRGAFALSAALTTGLGALWWLLARDDPPGAPPRIPPREPLRDILLGQFRVWRTPGLWRILSLHVVAYAAMATLLALWAGPFLHDVHGLSPAGRGWVLLAMGGAVPLGQLLVPPLERALGRDRAVAAMCGSVIAALLGLAAGPPLWAAVALLALVCAATAYSVLLVTQGRMLFPDHLVGRGVTTVNLAQVVGSAALPVGMGLAVGALGYGAGFLLLAVCLALGLWGYLVGTAAPPR